MFWCEVPLDFHPRHQAWRINALGHPSRLKAVLDLTGYVVVSNIYLVLHPRSVANEIPTKTTYLTQQTAGDLVGWLLTNHQPRQKTRCGFWFCESTFFLHFDCFELGENKGPSWMVEVAQVGFVFFSWLVYISELVKFFNFMGVI